MCFFCVDAKVYFFHFCCWSIFVVMLKKIEFRPNDSKLSHFSFNVLQTLTTAFMLWFCREATKSLSLILWFSFIKGIKNDFVETFTFKWKTIFLILTVRHVQICSFFYGPLSQFIMLSTFGRNAIFIASVLFTIP